MQNLRCFLFCLILAVIGFIMEGKAQEKQSPNSLNPGSSSSTALVKHSKRKKTRFFAPRRPDVKHTARYEFYERVEKAAKEKQRILKVLSKPQYSDYRYFGHKKIPKRRNPNKMRYCGECGIRH
ncbi:MAG TPA: hypothetical protein VIT44_09935 [Cyclobacteriaceae bacterium]